MGGLAKRLAPQFEMEQRLLEQKQIDKNELYSLHVSEVECIAKGKAHKKCEFGCKLIVAIISKDNFLWLGRKLCMVTLMTDTLSMTE